MKKIALAEGMKTMYMALAQRGFGIDGAEPIEFKDTMQCTMKSADFTAFRMRIMYTLRFCHHRASCAGGRAPSPASIERV